jgi:hypothetical protein
MKFGTDQTAAFDLSSLKVRRISSLLCSVADPTFSIPDPGSRRFRIPDPDPHQRISVFKSNKLFFGNRNDPG